MFSINSIKFYFLNVYYITCKLVKCKVSNTLKNILELYICFTVLFYFGSEKYEYEYVCSHGVLGLCR